jgi:hypothetical protein
MLIKAAAVLSATSGVGFGIPCAYAVWYLARQGQIWILLGFPTYGAGPFTRIGIDTSVPLLTTFLVVCMAEVSLGWLLWQQPAAGAWVALALLAVELVFWIGFALPYGVALGVARTVLILVSSFALSGTGT